MNYPKARRSPGTRGDICSRCGVNKRAGATEAYCKPCRTQYNTENADRRKAQVAERNHRQYVTNDAIIVEAKNVPCADCKQSYPYYVMDFDHVRGKKRRNISAMRTSRTEMLLEEIAKCDVVCANCHRERTAQRLLHATQWVKMLDVE